MHFTLIKALSPIGRGIVKYGIQKTSKNIVRKGAKKIAGETIVGVAQEWKSIHSPGKFAKVVFNELKDATLETVEKTKECAYYFAALVDDAEKHLNQSSLPAPEIVACWSIFSPLGSENDRAIFKALTGEQAKAIANEAAQTAQEIANSTAQNAQAIASGTAQTVQGIASSTAETAQAFANNVAQTAQGIFSSLAQGTQDIGAAALEKLQSSYASFWK